MKLFCLSDIHGDFGVIDRIKRTISDHDLIIVSGDLTNFNSRMVAEKMIESLQALGPLLLVPGNCDLPESQTLFEERGISLHGQGRAIAGVGFFGVGGSNFTPFETPFEISEDAISNFLNSGYRQIMGCKKKVMVSHPPPYGTNVDETGSGVHGGSKAVHDFIEKFDVDLVLCGHIHESKGEDLVNDTRVINIGPSHKGFVSIELSERMEYDFVDF